MLDMYEKDYIKNVKINEEDNQVKRKVADARRKMLTGLNKQLDYERARHKTMKTPEDMAKSKKRIADIELSIAKVHKGAEEDKKKEK
jgi:hypothetical protein